MGTEVKKKSPNLSLREAEGNYVIGEFRGRFENKTYAGVFSSLIAVTETNGSTKLWDGEKEVEVNIDEGDTVFFKETRWLNKFMSERKVGDKIRIEYTGTQKSKVKGRKATFTYNMEVL